ncbi:MAG: prepilin peptidase [Anaerolineae bacterium]|nr:prepilin peptidase [Anaerolineae bacterium]
MLAKILLFALLGWCGGALVNWLSDVLCSLRLDSLLADVPCKACVLPKQCGAYLTGLQRCSQCSRWRARYLLVNIVFVGISIWLGGVPPAGMPYGVSMALMLFFGVVTVIDVEHRLILHPVSWVGALMGLGFGIWWRGPVATLLGGAAGFALMLSLYFFGDLFAKWMARLRAETLEEVALGFGDVNLAGILGLLLGWPGVIGGLVLAVLLGGVFSLLYLVGMLIVERRYRAFAAIPYGPFLVASGVILLFLQDFMWGILP